MEVFYRDMKKKDWIEVRKLINREWFDEFNTTSDYNPIDEAYLYHHLANSNYHLMAVNEKDEVLGFIFGKIGKISSYRKNKYNKLYNEQLKYLEKIGLLKGLAEVIDEFELDKKLVEACTYPLENELELFIVNEKARSLGIGSSLEKHLIEHLKELKKDHVYLFTDTYSNYAYYEKKGYTRVCSIDEEENSKEQFYIYRKTL